MCICALSVCLVAPGFRKRYASHGCKGWLWAIVWMLGTKSSGRAPSAFKGWAISSAPKEQFLKWNILTWHNLEQGKMAHLEKVPAAKPDDQSSIPKTQKVKGESLLPNTALWPPCVSMHMHVRHTCAHSHTHTQTQRDLEKGWWSGEKLLTTQKHGWTYVQLLKNLASIESTWQTI